MRIYNESFVIEGKIRPENLLDEVENNLNVRLASNCQLLRYAIIEVSEKSITVEAAILEGLKRKRVIQILPEFLPSKFVVVNIVPTGLQAEFGGRIGDATPICNVLTQVADFVITHPNVLNAALLNYAKEKVLYVEGYTLDQLLTRKVVLETHRFNTLGVILDKAALKTPDFHLAINTIEAKRAILGIKVIDYIITERPVGGKAYRMKSGAFSGFVENPQTFLKAAKILKGKGAEAVAIATQIEISLEDLEGYLAGKLPNPYGGTEALISHTISKFFGIPCAHAPIISEREKEIILEKGRVDPRLAAEAVSSGYLGSVLRGLAWAPRILSKERFIAYPPLIPSPNLISLEDIKAVILPADCLGGIPAMACQKYQIPLIAVKENKTVLDVTSEKLGLKNVILAENYFEAIGIVATLKAEVALESLRRPLLRLDERRQNES